MTLKYQRILLKISGEALEMCIRDRCTGVGQVLGLADVDIHILAGSGVANDHAFVDLFTLSLIHI